MPHTCRSIRSLLAPALLCLLCAAPTLAQTAGLLRGSVTDIKGSPLGGVVITVASGSQGLV